MATIAFIGLGIMGGPMAGHLVQAGHTVIGVNRSPAPVQKLVEAGGRGAAHRPKAPDALAALVEYDWPGNVRELAHVLERAVLATDTAIIRAADLPSFLVTPERVASGATADRPTLDALERRYIAFVLSETRGNQSRAAAILGISRKALWERRKRYGME